MVQKSAKGLYTANLGNILAHETVAIELRCARLLRFEQGRVRLCIPTVISERYGNAHGPGALAPHESVEVNSSAAYPLSLQIRLLGDVAKGTVSCPSHGIKTSVEENGLCLTLSDGATLDRDFILLMEGVQDGSLAQYVQGDEESLMVASFAPHLPQQDVSPLALKILVDCSGSMGGERIQQARKGLAQVVNQLLPEDHVSFSRFGSDVQHMTSALLPCTPSVIQRLMVQVEATEADMGGTGMKRALTSTFINVSAPHGCDEPSVVLLLTDGDVWEVDKITQAAKASGHRIFAIGVGSAPSESLLRDMAEQTDGACEIVTPHENMADAVVRMFHRIRGVTAKNVRLQWGAEPIWQSVLPPYLYDGETVHCFAILKERPTEAPTLHWQAQGRACSVSADHVEMTPEEDLLRLGKTRQMQEAGSVDEQRDIALQHQLVSDHTALILTYVRKDAGKGEGLPKIRYVPQMPAHGHGCCGVMSFASIGCAIAMPGLDNFITGFPLIGFPWMPKKTAPRHSKADEVKHFVGVWSDNLYTSETVMECLAAARTYAHNSHAHEFVVTLHTDMGVSMEQAWAVFMQWALEKADGGIDRHSLRLLHATLAGIAQMDRDAMKLRLDGWLVQ